MIREAKFSSFGSNSSPFGEIPVSSFLSTFLCSEKVVEIREISENCEFVVPETLFSEADISSNICRIEMKSRRGKR